MFLSETNMVNLLKQTAQEGSKFLHQCGCESDYLKLMLDYTNTRKYCGKEANLRKLLLYYVCRPERGTVPQDMALTEQNPDLVVTYEPAKPTRTLLVELTDP